MIVASNDMSVNGVAIKKGDEIIGIPQQELNILLSKGFVVEKKAEKVAKKKEEEA